MVLSRNRGFRYQDWGHAVSFESTYPLFTEKSALLQKLNDMLQKESEKAAAEFGNFQWTEFIERIREPAFGNHWDAVISIDVIHRVSEAASLLENSWEYTGGLHGNGFSLGRNFVLMQDQVRELKLADLFDPNSNWDERLITYCRNELRSQKAAWMIEDDYADPSWPRPPAMPEEANPFPNTGVGVKQKSGNHRNSMYRADFGLSDLTSFTLSPSGLRFYFSTYQVGPYSDGAYSVKIPYEVVLDCIPHDSPARLFMQPDIPQ